MSTRAHATERPKTDRGILTVRILAWVAVALFMAGLLPESRRGKLEECPSCFRTVIVPAAGARIGGKLALPWKTPRLALRRLVPADGNDLAELMVDVEAFRYIDWEPLEIDEVESWLEKDGHTRLTDKGGSLCLALEFLERPKVVGFLSLYLLDEPGAQLGFTMMVHPQYRRMGLGSEAVVGAAGLAFTNLNAHRISVTFDTRNTAAAQMLEKARFRREAECRKGEFQKGQWVDTFWYALLREEYVPTA